MSGPRPAAADATSAAAAAAAAGAAGATGAAATAGATGAVRSGAELAELDAADPLAALRRRFVLPDGVIYLDGHSLGALPGAVGDALGRTVAGEWGEGLARSWDGSWMRLPENVGERVAPLIGAAPGQVVACDTTSVVMAKLLGAALDARRPGAVVVTTDDNFPTDLYVAEGVCARAGAELRRLARSAVEAGTGAGAGAGTGPGGAFEGADVVVLTHVDYRTGAMFDLEAVTRRAHDAGALCIWDLSHSAGAVPVGVDAAGVDLAFGCGYKYLNGGPGAPAFCYVRADLQQQLRNPLPGWMGHAAPFDFSADYVPAPGARRFVTSTPPVLGLVALDAALTVWEGVDLADVRAKSLALTDRFIAGVSARLGDVFSVATPLDHDRRGSQVSLRVRPAPGRPAPPVAGQRVVGALVGRGVLCDFRPPDLCRFGFAPLYLRFGDVGRALDVLEEVVGDVLAR